MQVSVRELKNHLSRYLHLVTRGEHLIVTSHSTPLAKVMPIQHSDNPDIEPLLQIEGVSWNGKKPKGIQKQIKLKKSKKNISDYVSEDRG